MNFIYTILLVSLLTVGLAYMAYRIFLQSQKKTQDYIENNEFKDKIKTSKSNLLFFYTNWCDHCRNSKPIWKQIQTDSDIQKFNLNFIDINCEDEKNNALLKNYNIKEYPTVILEHNNKKFIFDANLDAETLLKFLSSVYR